jgi:1-acyl-sn-glycerol-3-phosphate acyltransferase
MVTSATAPVLATPVAANPFYNRQLLPLRLLYTVISRTRATGAGNLPRYGGVILACNHLSMLDPWLLAVLFPRPLYFMAKEELYRTKPVGWYLHRAGAFPVKRGSSDRSAIKHAEALLRRGEVVMLFPEGHRSEGAGAQSARAGAVLLALRTNSPILPVGIWGTENLRLRSAAGKSPWRFVSRPAIGVRAGVPIHLDPSRRGHSNRQQAADLVMRCIVELLPPAYHGVYAGAAARVPAVALEVHLTDPQLGAATHGASQLPISDSRERKDGPS